MGDSFTRDLLFPKLTEDDLASLANEGSEVALSVGDVLFQEGDAPSSFCVLLDGEIKVTRRVGEEELLLAVHQPGEFTGEISILSGANLVATGRATKPSRLICISLERFRQIVLTGSPLALTILNAIVARRPEAEALVRQREKLMALGKFSAGLAHELNNPAAAAKRAAAQFRESLLTQQTQAMALGGYCLSEGQMTYLSGLAAEYTDPARVKPPLDPLQQSEQEDALAEWMEAHGVDDGWRLASEMIECGVGVPQMEELSAKVGDNALSTVVEWISASVCVAALLGEIEQSTERISDLVKSIKSYTYMDQAARQEIDVHAGLDNTVTMLSHKLKSVKIVREYDRSLPRIMAYGGELNQVWTNIIDNAIDAMEGKGKLTLRTSREDDCLFVEIEDTGPGIPPEIKKHIFEPFFTTKGVGEGTGLGLDTSYKIIVEHHKGDLTVTSEPGKTQFQVRLPIQSSDPCV